jgi:hypothetical protein
MKSCGDAQAVYHDKVAGLGSVWKRCGLIEVREGSLTRGCLVAPVFRTCFMFAEYSVFRNRARCQLVIAAREAWPWLAVSGLSVQR